MRILNSLVVALALSAPASAEQYFQFRPLSEIHSGGFFRLGTPVDNVRTGVVTPVIVHDKAWGHWLIPGVTWTLLNVGGVFPTSGGKDGLMALGPSVNLDEPIKAGLRWGVDRLPGDPAAYSALRSILAPAAGDGVYLAAGPMFALEMPDIYRTVSWRGALLFGVTLRMRLGGTAVKQTSAQASAQAPMAHYIVMAQPAEACQLKPAEQPVIENFFTAEDAQ